MAEKVGTISSDIRCTVNKDGTANMETLSKLYLELAHVVPKGTRTFRELEVEQQIKKALHHLDYATPSQRNGPVYQAADTLRSVLGMEPMEIGGKPTDGMA